MQTTASSSHPPPIHASCSLWVLVVPELGGVEVELGDWNHPPSRTNLEGHATASSPPVNYGSIDSTWPCLGPEISINYGSSGSVKEHDGICQRCQ